MSETPILDLELEPPKLRRPWLAYLLGGVIGALIGFYLADRIDSLWWLPILYVSVAVHEVGHLIAAKLVGMEAGGIVIGGLVIFKSGSRWLTRFEWRRILSGGLFKPLPRKGDFDPARYAWMVAGGPLATALLIGTGGIAFWRSPAGAGGWLGTLWWINVALGILCLLPSRGVNKSDGARLWQLLRHPEEARSAMALLQLQTEETAGVQPRDWDAGLFEEMLKGDPKAGESSYRQMLAFYRRIDEGNEAAALLHLENALARSGCCGRLVKHWCFLEAACSSAIIRGDPEKARTWLARATRLRKPQSKHGLEAAIAMSEKRYEDAVRHWDAALADLAKRKLDSGLARFGKAKIAEYQSRCREAIELAADPAAAG
jgi:hypothetical protein